MNKTNLTRVELDYSDVDYILYGFDFAGDKAMFITRLNTRIANKIKEQQNADNN